MQYVREGKLKALGVTSAQRSPRLPDIPTIAETALPGYEAIAWYGVFAPAKTPPSAIAALNAEIVRIMKLDDVQERVRTIGLDPTSSTPDAFAAYLATEIKKWGELVRASGAQAD
jgi:tripartite-type tricarboxylate transporter receptor subunit TctC